MAEAKKPGIVAKAQKRLSRTKTKVLQTLGKADRSTDETFDDLVQKTEKQHDVAHHLQKEIKTYVHCVRALSHASKALATALSQTYEEEWTEEAGFKKGLESLDLLWEDYLQSMATQVIEPMNTYIASFPGLKTRVAKRRRKTMDYDNSRHSLETLQQAKKKDDAKIAKAQEDLNESKKIYEDLHNELCTELPDFYNSRVTFYADLFQKFFGCERTLHFETSRISESLNQICQNLSKDYMQFVYQPKRPVSKSLSDNSDEPKVTNGDSSPHQPSSASASPATTPTTAMAVNRVPQGAAAADDDDDDEDHFYGNQDVVNAAAKVNGDAEKVKEILTKLQELENSLTFDMKSIGGSGYCATATVPQGSSIKSPTVVIASPSPTSIQGKPIPSIQSQPLPPIPHVSPKDSAGSAEHTSLIARESKMQDGSKHVSPQIGAHKITGHKPCRIPISERNSPPEGRKRYANTPTVFMAKTYQEEIEQALYEESQVTAAGAREADEHIDCLPGSAVHDVRNRSREATSIARGLMLPQCSPPPTYESTINDDVDELFQGAVLVGDGDVTTRAELSQSTVFVSNTDGEVHVATVPGEQANNKQPEMFGQSVGNLICGMYTKNATDLVVENRDKQTLHNTRPSKQVSPPDKKASPSDNNVSITQGKAESEDVENSGDYIALDSDAQRRLVAVHSDSDGFQVDGAYLMPGAEDIAGIASSFSDMSLQTNSVLSIVGEVYEVYEALSFTSQDDLQKQADDDPCIPSHTSSQETANFEIHGSLDIKSLSDIMELDLEHSVDDGVVEMSFSTEINLRKVSKDDAEWGKQEGTLDNEAEQPVSPEVNKTLSKESLNKSTSSVLNRTEEEDYPYEKEFLLETSKISSEDSETKDEASRGRLEHSEMKDEANRTSPECCGTKDKGSRSSSQHSETKYNPHEKEFPTETCWKTSPPCETAVLSERATQRSPITCLELLKAYEESSASSQESLKVCQKSPTAYVECPKVCQEPQKANQESPKLSPKRAAEQDYYESVEPIYEPYQSVDDEKPILQDEFFIPPTVSSDPSDSDNPPDDVPDVLAVEITVVRKPTPRGDLNPHVHAAIAAVNNTANSPDECKHKGVILQTDEPYPDEDEQKTGRASNQTNKKAKEGGLGSRMFRRKSSTSSIKKGKGDVVSDTAKVTSKASDFPKPVCEPSGELKSSEDKVTDDTTYEVTDIKVKSSTSKGGSKKRKSRSPERTPSEAKTSKKRSSSRTSQKSRRYTVSTQTSTGKGGDEYGLLTKFEATKRGSKRGLSKSSGSRSGSKQKKSPQTLDEPLTYSEAGSQTDHNLSTTYNSSVNFTRTAESTSDQGIPSSQYFNSSGREDVNRNFGGSQEQIFLNLPFSLVSHQSDLDNACGDQVQNFLSLPFTMVSRPEQPDLNSLAHAANSTVNSTSGCMHEEVSTSQPLPGESRLSTLEEKALYLTSSFREVMEGGRSDPTLAQTVLEVYLTAPFSRQQTEHCEEQQESFDQDNFLEVSQPSNQTGDFTAAKDAPDADTACTIDPLMHASTRAVNSTNVCMHEGDSGFSIADSQTAVDEDCVYEETTCGSKSPISRKAPESQQAGDGYYIMPHQNDDFSSSAQPEISELTVESQTIHREVAVDTSDPVQKEDHEKSLASCTALISPSEDRTQQGSSKSSSSLHDADHQAWRSAWRKCNSPSNSPSAEKQNGSYSPVFCLSTSEAIPMHIEGFDKSLDMHIEVGLDFEVDNPETSTSVTDQPGRTEGHYVNMEFKSAPEDRLCPGDSKSPVQHASYVDMRDLRKLLKSQEDDCLHVLKDNHETVLESDSDHVSSSETFSADVMEKIVLSETTNLVDIEKVDENMEGNAVIDEISPIVHTVTGTEDSTADCMCTVLHVEADQEIQEKKVEVYEQEENTAAENTIEEKGKLYGIGEQANEQSKKASVQANQHNENVKSGKDGHEVTVGTSEHDGEKCLDENKQAAEESLEAIKGGGELTGNETIETVKQETEGKVEGNEGKGESSEADGQKEEFFIGENKNKDETSVEANQQEEVDEMETKKQECTNTDTRTHSEEKDVHFNEQEAERIVQAKNLKKRKSTEAQKQTSPHVLRNTSSTNSRTQVSDTTGFGDSPPGQGISPSSDREFITIEIISMPVLPLKPGKENIPFTSLSPGGSRNADGVDLGAGGESVIPNGKIMLEMRENVSQENTGSTLGITEDAAVEQVSDYSDEVCVKENQTAICMNVKASCSDEETYGQDVGEFPSQADTVCVSERQPTSDLTGSDSSKTPESRSAVESSSTFERYGENASHSPSSLSASSSSAIGDVHSESSHVMVITSDSAIGSSQGDSTLSANQGTGDSEAERSRDELLSCDSAISSQGEADVSSSTDVAYRHLHNESVDLRHYDQGADSNEVGDQGTQEMSSSHELDRPAPVSKEPLGQQWPQWDSPQSHRVLESQTDTVARASNSDDTCCNKKQKSSKEIVTSKSSVNVGGFVFSSVSEYVSKTVASIGIMFTSPSDSYIQFDSLATGGTKKLSEFLSENETSSDHSALETEITSEVCELHSPTDKQSREPQSQTSDVFVDPSHEMAGKQEHAQHGLTEIAWEQEVLMVCSVAELAEEQQVVRSSMLETADKQETEDELEQAQECLGWPRPDTLQENVEQSSIEHTEKQETREEVGLSEGPENTEQLQLSEGQKQMDSVLELSEEAHTAVESVMEPKEEQETSEVWKPLSADDVHVGSYYTSESYACTAVENSEAQRLEYHEISYDTQTEDGSTSDYMFETEYQNTAAAFSDSYSSGQDPYSDDHYPTLMSDTVPFSVHYVPDSATFIADTAPFAVEHMTSAAHYSPPYTPSNPYSVQRFSNHASFRSTTRFQSQHAVSTAAFPSMQPIPEDSPYPFPYDLASAPLQAQHSASHRLDKHQASEISNPCFCNPPVEQILGESRSSEKETEMAEAEQMLAGCQSSEDTLPVSDGSKLEYDPNDLLTPSASEEGEAFEAGYTEGESFEAGYLKDEAFEDNYVEELYEEGGDDEDTGPLTNNYYEEPPHVNDDDDDEEDADFNAYQFPPSNQPVVAPPTNTLYQVEATHAYIGEDVDELSFDPGDIIYVVKFDNDEEQDDGWQMGVKQKDGLKGVFPENFTRKL